MTIKSVRQGRKILRKRKEQRDHLKISRKFWLHSFGEQNFRKGLLEERSSECSWTIDGDLETDGIMDRILKLNGE